MTINDGPAAVNGCHSECRVSNRMDECFTRYVAHIFIELYFKYEGLIMYDLGTHNDINFVIAAIMCTVYGRKWINDASI